MRKNGIFKRWKSIPNSLIGCLSIFFDSPWISKSITWWNKQKYVWTSKSTHTTFTFTPPWKSIRTLDLIDTFFARQEAHTDIQTSHIISNHTNDFKYAIDTILLSVLFITSQTVVSTCFPFIKIHKYSGVFPTFCCCFFFLSLALSSFSWMTTHTNGNTEHFWNNPSHNSFPYGFRSFVFIIFLYSVSVVVFRLRKVAIDINKNGNEPFRWTDQTFFFTFFCTPMCCHCIVPLTQ